MMPEIKDKVDVMSLSKDLEHENLLEEELHGNEEVLGARLWWETGVETVSLLHAHKYTEADFCVMCAVLCDVMVDDVFV